MEINNKSDLLEFIKRQSLKLVKENQAFSDYKSLEDRLADVHDGFVLVNEKRFDKLKAEEDKAMADEDYAELQRIKEEKVKILGKLIASYQKKTEILNELMSELKKEVSDLGSKGSNVFKDTEIKEFKNEDFIKGSVIKIVTLAAEIKVQKISDNNQFKIISTTVSGFIPGDILVIPDMVVGHPAQVRVYRSIDKVKFDEIGKTQLQTIKAIIKNPS